MNFPLLFFEKYTKPYNLISEMRKSRLFHILIIQNNCMLKVKKQEMKKSRFINILN